jgi:hypothetical protein
LLAAKKRSESEAAKVDGEGDKAFGEALNAIVETEERHKRMATDFSRVTRDLQARLDDKEAKAADIHDTFRAFKGQVAVQAEHSRTGKPLAKKEVALFRDAEKAKDDEVSRVRLRNVNLRLMLAKLEGQLRAKEQLAEGLHLIDFEQLKIENTSLSEKIMERAGEVERLRTKKKGSVEVLSHVKEKLHFTRFAAEASSKRLVDADADLGHVRELLTKNKREREALRRSNAGFNTDQGFTKSDRLVRDFEARKKALASIKDQIQETKSKYENLASFVKASGYS